MGRQNKTLKCIQFDCSHSSLLALKGICKKENSVVRMSQGIYLHGIVADFNLTRKLCPGRRIGEPTQGDLEKVCFVKIS